MRAGDFADVIGVEEYTSPQLAAFGDAYGTPQFVWAHIGKLRAEVVRRSASETVAAQGAVAEEVVIFRTRYFPGVKLHHRILHNGTAYNLREIVPDPRARTMELRCTRAE